jgi:hypothetical protein
VTPESAGDGKNLQIGRITPTCLYLLDVSRRNAGCLGECQLRQSGSFASRDDASRELAQVLELVFCALHRASASTLAWA